MPLLKDGEIVENAWVRVGDEAGLPADGGVIVSLTRWEAEAETLRGRNAPVGVRLESGEPVAALVDHLNDIDLVELDFPVYTDGRSYSAARRLRQRHGYDGEIRASGNVLRDQYAFMLRCGFDTFEIAEDADPHAWAKSAQAMSNVYQQAADGVQSIWAKRHAF